MARIVWDLDGTIAGYVRGRLMLRPNVLEVLAKLKREGHTLILWTFGNRQWWRHVRAAFPALQACFDEVYTSDDLPGHVSTGGSPDGQPRRVKDIRRVAGDLLVDNEPAHHEWARRHGLSAKYLQVRTFGIG